MKAQTSQQILKVLDNNWKSFFNTLKEWKKDKKIFNRRPRPPNYKKTCNNILIFTNQNSKIRGSKIILTMSHLFKDTFPKFENPIEVRISKYTNKSFERFQQIHILPRKRFYIIEIVYNEERKTSKVDTKRYLSIVFGLNDLITTVENTNVKPIIISGTVLKSINRQRNKRKVRIYSIKDKQRLKWTEKLDKITIKRNSVVNDYLHKTAQFIVGYCL